MDVTISWDDVVRDSDRIVLLRYIKQNEVLAKYCECGNQQEKYSVAKNKYASTEVLEKLAFDESKTVVSMALQNPNISNDVLYFYNRIGQYEKRKAIALNPSITNEMISDFVTDSDFRIVNALLCNPAIDEEIIKKIYIRIVQVATTGRLFGKGKEDLFFENLYYNSSNRLKKGPGRYIYDKFEIENAIKECIFSLIKNPRTPKSILDELEQMGYNCLKMRKYGTATECIKALSRKRI